MDLCSKLEFGRWNEISDTERKLLRKAYRDAPFLFDDIGQCTESRKRRQTFPLESRHSHGHASANVHSTGLTTSVRRKQPPAVSFESIAYQGLTDYDLSTLERKICDHSDNWLAEILPALEQGNERNGFNLDKCAKVYLEINARSKAERLNAIVQRILVITLHGLTDTATQRTRLVQQLASRRGAPSFESIKKKVYQLRQVGRKWKTVIKECGGSSGIVFLYKGSMREWRVTPKSSCQVAIRDLEKQQDLLDEIQRHTPKVNHLLHLAKGVVEPHESSQTAQSRFGHNSLVGELALQNAPARSDSTHLEQDDLEDAESSQPQLGVPNQIFQPDHDMDFNSAFRFDRQADHHMDFDSAFHFHHQLDHELDFNNAFRFNHQLDHDLDFDSAFHFNHQVNHNQLDQNVDLNNAESAAYADLRTIQMQSAQGNLRLSNASEHGDMSLADLFGGYPRSTQEALRHMSDFSGGAHSISHSLTCGLATE